MILTDTLRGLLYSRHTSLIPLWSSSPVLLGSQDHSAQPAPMYWMLIQNIHSLWRTFPEPCKVLPPGIVITM